MIFDCEFCNGLLAIKQRGYTWFGINSSWETTLRPGIEVHSFVSWLFSHMTQVSMAFESKGHSS